MGLGRLLPYFAARSMARSRRPKDAPKIGIFAGAKGLFGDLAAIIRRPRKAPQFYKFENFGQEYFAWRRSAQNVFTRNQVHPEVLKQFIAYTDKLANSQSKLSRAYLQRYLMTRRANGLIKVATNREARLASRRQAKLAMQRAIESAKERAGQWGIPLVPARAPVKGSTYPRRR